MSPARTKPCILCDTCSNAIRAVPSDNAARKCRAGIAMTNDMFACESYVRRFTYAAPRSWPIRPQLRRNAT